MDTITVSISAIANTMADILANRQGWHPSAVLTLDTDAMKAARKHKGLTQYDLADALNVSQPTIQRWENGKREPETLDVFARLCDVLDLTADELLGRPQKEGAAISASVPSEESLAGILGYALEVDMADRVEQERIQTAAGVVRVGLELIADDPDFDRNPGLLVAALKRAVGPPSDHTPRAGPGGPGNHQNKARNRANKA